MTRLSDVVRGVEIKKTDYGNNSLVRCSADATFGYNTLASAEVVVSAEEIKNIMDKFVYVGTKGNTGIMLMTEVRDKIAEQLATAIESGSIISLREEE